MKIQLLRLTSRMSGVGEPHVAGGRRVGGHDGALPSPQMVLLDVTVQLISLLPVSHLLHSHPSYGLQHFLRRSSDTVMPRPCLKTSVGCWHMVCAPQQGTQVLHCPFRLPSKLGDPCPSKPRLSPLAPFLSARSAPSSSPSEKAHHPSLVVMLPHCLATCVCCPGLPI